jgi:hypothetical protein
MAERLRIHMLWQPVMLTTMNVGSFIWQYFIGKNFCRWLVNHCGNGASRQLTFRPP